MRKGKQTCGCRQLARRTGGSAALSLSLRDVEGPDDGALRLTRV